MLESRALRRIRYLQHLRSSLSYRPHFITTDSFLPFKFPPGSFKLQIYRKINVFRTTEGLVLRVVSRIILQNLIVNANDTDD